MATALGQSLGQTLGAAFFGGNFKKAQTQGMLDGAKAYELDASAKRSLADALRLEADRKKIDLQASEINSQMDRQKPENLLRFAMQENQIPLQDFPEVQNYINSGKLGGKFDLAADGYGPALPSPDWASRLPDLSRSMGMTQKSMALGDKSIKNLTEAEGMKRDIRLQDQVLAKQLDPTLLAQSQGKKVFDFKEFGVGNELTGTLNENTGAARNYGNLRKSQEGAQKANAAQSYASAGASNASAARTRQAIGLDQQEFGLKKQEFDLKKAGGGVNAKPLPASALKMQQEAIDAIGVSGGINADLNALEKQITDKKLSFGPVSNLTNAGLNMTGFSSQESRNFATFKSNVERLRNESLRLNTGVQTDGDAQRAWNELFQNINDTDLVKQRLQEIQRINKRGADLQKLKIDSIRANYGHDPLDVSRQMNQNPALLGGGATGGSGDDAVQSLLEKYK